MRPYFYELFLKALCCSYCVIIVVHRVGSAKNILDQPTKAEGFCNLQLEENGSFLVHFSLSFRETERRSLLPLLLLSFLVLEGALKELYLF